MFSTWRHLHYFGAIFCLLLVLTACSQQSDNQASPGLSPTTTSSTPSPRETTAVQTCPPQATARAAIMPHLTAGNHPNIVYVSQSGDSSILRRYDVSTGSTQTILSTNGTETITEANISPDGQWVLLVALLQNQLAIQLVRIDGQHLQTLYCAPAQMDMDAALLSPNQHFLVFDQVEDENISTLYLLNLTTGQLHTELSPLQPGYPDLAQAQSQTTTLSMLSSLSFSDKTTDNRKTSSFTPWSSKHYLIYIPMKWYNNSVYLIGTVRATGAIPHQLALLRDINEDVTEQASNLQLITAPFADNGCQDYDVTPDNQQLVCSAYTLLGPVTPSTIMMRPMTGTTFHSIYSEPMGGRIVARVLSNSTLIFIQYQRTGPPSLWKINIDSSGLTQLLSTSSSDMDLSFAYASYLPWSITSPNSNLYALIVANLANSTQSLIFGSLSGGAVKTAASNSNSIVLSGWAEA
jgi:hypothetical protein